MKRLLFLVFALVCLTFINGCKKCFTCYNECTLCSLTASGHVFTKQLCKDSFTTEAAYKAAITTDSTAGYTCAPTTPSYKYDFCVNNPGKDNYPDYFNKGGRVTCAPK